MQLSWLIIKRSGKPDAIYLFQVNTNYCLNKDACAGSRIKNYGILSCGVQPCAAACYLLSNMSLSQHIFFGRYLFLFQPPGSLVLTMPIKKQKVTAEEWTAKPSMPNDQ